MMKSHILKFQSVLFYDAMRLSQAFFGPIRSLIIFPKTKSLEFIRRQKSGIQMQSFV